VHTLNYLNCNKNMANVQDPDEEEEYEAETGDVEDEEGERGEGGVHVGPLEFPERDRYKYVFDQTLTTYSMKLIVLAALKRKKDRVTDSKGTVVVKSTEIQDILYAIRTGDITGNELLFLTEFGFLVSFTIGAHMAAMNGTNVVVNSASAFLAMFVYNLKKLRVMLSATGTGAARLGDRPYDFDGNGTPAAILEMKNTNRATVDNAVDFFQRVFLTPSSVKDMHAEAYKFGLLIQVIEYVMMPKVDLLAATLQKFTFQGSIICNDQGQQQQQQSSPFTSGSTFDMAHKNEQLYTLQRRLDEAQRKNEKLAAQLEVAERRWQKGSGGGGGGGGGNKDDAKKIRDLESEVVRLRNENALYDRQTERLEQERKDLDERLNACKEKLRRCIKRERERQEPEGDEEDDEEDSEEQRSGSRGTYGNFPRRNEGRREGSGRGGGGRSEGVRKTSSQNPPHSEKRQESRQKNYGYADEEYDDDDNSQQSQSLSSVASIGTTATSTSTTASKKKIGRVAPPLATTITTNTNNPPRSKSVSVVTQQRPVAPPPRQTQEQQLSDDTVTLAWDEGTYVPVDSSSSSIVSATPSFRQKPRQTTATSVTSASGSEISKPKRTSSVGNAGVDANRGISQQSAGIDSDVEYEDAEADSDDSQAAVIQPQQKQQQQQQSRTIEKGKGKQATTTEAVVAATPVVGRYNGKGPPEPYKPELGTIKAYLLLLKGDETGKRKITSKDNGIWRDICNKYDFWGVEMDGLDIHLHASDGKTLLLKNCEAGQVADNTFVDSIYRYFQLMLAKYDEKAHGIYSAELEDWIDANFEFVKKSGTVVKLFEYDNGTNQKEFTKYYNAYVSKQ